MTCGFDAGTVQSYDTDWTNTINSLTQKGNATSKSHLTEMATEIALFLGPACGNGENQNYLAHMNTPNVARDFDLVRNLTGYPTMSYWGFSYGSILGTMYAQLFPERVGRIVIDGSLDTLRD